MCMMAPKFPKMPPLLPFPKSSWAPAHSVNPHVPPLFWHWMITYGMMGTVAGLLLAAVMS